ncbi:MAG: DUF748 domain-containing protein [Pseudomonadota bacterium]
MNETLKSPKWWRRGMYCLGTLLLMWVLAYALVPLVLKSQIQKIASEKLGRQVTLGAVDFKPWSLELALMDLSIAKAGAQTTSTAQLSIKRIYVNAELESLLRLAPVLNAIEIDQPVISLTHLGDGKYDIDDIAARFKPVEDDKTGEPQRFALYNLQLRGGQLDFIDQTVGKTHELRDFSLAVPFLSNLKSKLEIKTSPRLAFKLNGSSFDSAAEGTPFAQTRKTDAVIKLAGFDLSPYLAYMPASLPFKLQKAVLNVDVKLAFEQTPDNLVRLSGTVTADKVSLFDKTAAKTSAGHEMLAFEQLKIVMQDVQPLDQLVRLSAIELTSPTLGITRDRAGRLNLLPSASSNSTATVAAVGKPGMATSASPAASSPKPVDAAKPWKVEIASVLVRGGKLNWLDETLATPARISLADLSLDASAIALPFAASAPLQFRGSLGLSPGADSPPLIVVGGSAAKAPSVDKKPAAASSPAALIFTGTATDQAAQVSATVASWPLNMAARYVGQFLLPALNGQLDAQLGVNWKAGSADQAPALQLTAPGIALRDVQLAQGKVSLVSVKQVDVAGVDINVPGQTFRADKMLLSQPKAIVERDAEKRWMYERWMVGAGQGSTPAPPPTREATRTSAPSWALAIDEVALDGGAMVFSDKAGAKAVAFELGAVKAQVRGLVLDDRPASKALVAKQMPLSASLRLTAGRFEPGKLDFKGFLGLVPMQAQGQLQVERLPVQAFEPYFANALNVELLRADASFKGKIAYRQTPAGPTAQVSGDVALEELKANTLAPSEDLLAWKALKLRGLSVALDPAQATQVEVRETVLSDFFARVIVTPEGRINLQDLLKPSSAGTVTTTASLAETPVAAKKQASGASAAAQASMPAATSGSTPASASGQAPVISFGPMSLINGKVLFSDRFVKPNYSADLTDLTGKLSAFSSVSATGTPNMADLELRGRAEGTASLEIVGKLNPLAKPLALDISGKVRDLELPPLSPYSVKYSGYGINRGKLSVDVNYLVQPNGQLTAKNKVVLNQLSFGDKVEGSSASLPVKLAVALLADRNGVIDLDLPISGSLNDPQFSLGPIIVKVILNVIVKAITAPFSLLASALGGGGEELSTVAFAPGSAQLAPDARGGLDKVAKALTDRPALKLTVVGTSSLEAERDGFKRERLAELVRAEKRRATVKDGGTTSAVVSVSTAEYPVLLKEVYKRADFSKPRNVIGLLRDLPVEDMENLLLADIRVNEDAMRELAVQRGVAVKDYLASRNLPPERLFLGAAKAVLPEAKWTPRAELNLASP